MSTLLLPPEATQPRPIVADPVDDVELGRGRCGVVWQSRDALGRPIARKVFVADGVSSAVHLVLSGAENPYRWNENAVAAAVARRRILAILADVWFGERLRLPEVISWGFCRRWSAFAIDLEMIQGRHPRLRTGIEPDEHPPSEADAELSDLYREIMKPLQRRLIEAGFDGLLWQAGLGNPVALNNFVLETVKSSDGGRFRRWVWLDLESGLPAIAPLNPWQLVRFYLPKSIALRRLLFDDVDCRKLKTYCRQLQHRLPPGQWQTLSEQISLLDAAQQHWREPSRLERGLAAAEVTGDISKTQAAYYREHPVAWHRRVTVRLLRGAADYASRKVLAIVHKWRWRSAIRAARTLARFAASQAYRRRVGIVMLKGRARALCARGQITLRQKERMIRWIGESQTSAYVTDFAVHLSLKPLSKALVCCLLPLAVAVGLLSPFVGVALAFVMGAALRTLYTLGRTMTCFTVGQPGPWLALVVGLLPVVGGTAYGVQIVAGPVRVERRVGRFLLYSFCAEFGARLPIWGGRDTLTEHVLNRLPALLFSRLPRKLHRIDSSRNWFAQSAPQR